MNEKFDKNKAKLTLFDDYYIDFRPKTTRRWYTPEPFSAAPHAPYSSLIYDPERKVYRIYGEVLDPHGTTSDSKRMLMLSESTDMKEFRHIKGSDGSDYVFDGDGGIHGGTVMYDIYENDPSKRYKFCGMTQVKREAGEKRSDYKVVLAFSEDGVNFVHRPDIVANPYTSDTLNKLFYNPYTEEYNLLLRSAYVDRRISVRSSKDMVNWSEPEILFYPDASMNSDAVETQHYAMSAGYYDGIFYGLLWRYDTLLYDSDYWKMEGVIEPELVYSYDGKRFMQTTGRALMERPYPPAPGWAGLAPQDMCLSADGKDYFILCSGYIYIHGSSDLNDKNGKMFAGRVKRYAPVYKIRRDGFCGIESVGYGGEVVFKPMRLTGSVSFNLRANAGFVRFALTDINGKPFEGFSYDDCVPFEFDDDTDVVPVWKGHNISELFGRQLRINVELNGAVLHSVSLSGALYIRQPQRSFYDPQGL